MTIAGACIFIIFFRRTVYRIYYHVPVHLSLICGAECLAGAAAAFVGRRLYKADGESPKAQMFYGALLCLTGVGSMVMTLYRVISYSGAPVVELPTPAILAVLGVWICCRACRARKAAARETMGTSEPVPPPVPEPPKPAEPTVAVCPDCGKRYPLDKVYCEECGALLERR